MRGKTVFFSIFLTTILITGSFQYPAFAKDPIISPMENITDYDTASYVPGQLIVGLDKPDPHFSNKAAIYGGQVINSIPQIKAHVVKVPINTEDKFIAAMSNNPNVLYVEHDGIVKAHSIPNDTYYSAQWGTKRIGMESVWSSSFDEGSGIMIAVLDEGLYYDHPDFWGTSIRTDIDKDFVDGDNDTRPTRNCFNPFMNPMERPEDHGTFVAGVIISAINDDFGLAGVGKFDLLPVRVLNECGGGSYSVVAQGIIYASDMGADVINLSLGSEFWEQKVLSDAVDYATAYPAETVIVASSGNSALQGNPTNYPAAYEKVISVGATAVDDKIASYSSFGPTLDLSAPGAEAPEGTCSINGMTYILTTAVDTTSSGNIDATNPAWELACVAGTSFAAPYVSAVAGLVKYVNNNATHEDIKCHLEQTAEDLGPVGWDQKFGHGLVRADIAYSTPLISSSQCEAVDLAPIITLLGANPQIIEAEPLDIAYTELGATAIDDLDGDISDNIIIDSSFVDTSVPGLYGVTYDVTDSSGNAAAQVVRTVKVQDTTPPQITLDGTNPQIIEVNTAYTELGASASDTLDGDLSGSIVIDSSAVNVSVPGNYNVTYDVSDLAGNAAEQVVRTVIVQDTVGGSDTIHVGDLNWEASNKKTWNAKVFITIHDQDELPVPGVVVQGTFSGDGISPVNCTTDSQGVCQVTQSTKLDSMTFSVVGISATGFTPSDAHHDPNGDFTGEPIVTISRGINSIGGTGGGDGGSDSSCPPNSNKPSCR